MSVMIESRSDQHYTDALVHTVKTVVKERNPLHRILPKIRARRKEDAPDHTVHITKLTHTQIVDTTDDAIRFIKRDFSLAAEWAVVNINFKTRVLEVLEKQRTNTWHRHRHADATLKTRLRATYWLVFLSQRVGLARELCEATLEGIDGRFAEFHHGWEQTTTRTAVIDPDLCDTRRCNYECLAHCPPRRAGFAQGIPTERNYVIAAESCIECGVCVCKCPLGAIKLMNVPKW